MRDKYQNKGFNKVLNHERAKKIKEHIKFTTGSCIDLGCGEGQITKYLINDFRYITAVDSDKELLSYVTKKAERFCHDIEDFKTCESFDMIICTNTLEHVDNPQKILKNIKPLGYESSTFFFSVPNAESYNRLVGVDMGTLNKATELGVQDIEVGHKRMYTLKTFVNEIKKAGYKIKESGTMIFKPLPNSLMDKMSNQIIKKCLSLPMRNNGAEIYVVATNE